jgi:3-hydroxybutyryl-CoA dehydrogenase
MGQGIAQVAAQAGYRVRLLDASAELAQAGADKIEKRLARLVDKGKLTVEDAGAASERITTHAAAAELAECQLAVEAAPERESLKVEIFQSLDAVLAPEAILASNTSSISITKLSAAVSRPDKVIGMHFMNPVPVMKLVEIIRGLPTSDATYDTTRALAEKMGKTVVTSRDIPGFIVNRILIPMLNEACFALYEGLGSADDIDTGIKLGLNHPMGPLALADLIGLDTCLSIAEVLHSEFGDSKYRPCPLLRQHVAAGWLGRKSGRGFYQYDERGKRI